MRRWLLLLSLAAAAYAQTPGPAASLQIIADEDSVLIGRTLQLRAVVRDAQGRIRTGDNVVWGTNNASMATINASTGELRATGLGVVTVSATTGGVRGDAPIQTMPRDVTIEPRTSTLDVGQTLQFTVTVYDADGRVIPAGFTWSVLNRNQTSTSALATVTNAGLVRGVYEGGITVRATYTYNSTIVGMQRQWFVAAPVNVRVPRGYELVKLGRDRVRQNYELRARPSMLWGNDNGDLYFNASLGGLANGLLYMGSEGFKLVGAGGTTRFTLGSFTTDYRIHSVAQNGRIMTLEATNNAGIQVNWGDHRSGLTPFLASGAPLAGTENGNNAFLTRNSHTSSGWVLLRASYRVPGSNPVVNGVGLFRGYGDRVTELLVSNLDPIEGLTGALSIDGDFGITDDGVAYYTVSAGTNRILFRHQAERQKVVGVNDPAINSTVRSFLGGGGNRPTFFVSERGDLLYGVTLNNNEQHFFRWPAGATAPQTLRLNSQAGFLWHSSAGDTLLYGNPLGSRGNGVHVWPREGPLRTVAVFGQTTVLGQGIQDCESGFLHANGDASVMMRLTVANMAIIRFFAGGGDPWVIIQHGEQVPVEAPINLLNFVGGGRTGPVHLMTGGESGSVTQAAGDEYTPVVTIGSRFFTTQMWFGGSTNNSTFNMRKSPTGDIYFTNGIGIGRVRAGAAEPELFLRTPFALPGGAAGQNVNAPFWVDANTRGDVLWAASTGAGDNRMYVTSPDGQTHRLVAAYSAATNTATVIDGKTLLAIDSYGIDDLGRVMLGVRFRNQPNAQAYLWENGQFTFLAEANVSTIGGKSIAGVTNVFRGGGQRLFAQFSIVGGNQIICEWTGAWRVLLDNTERLVHGQVINSVNGYDVNRNGDILFRHSAGIPYMMVRKADGKQVMVMNEFERTPAGEYIIRVLNVDFRDDGTVYFLGVNADDEQVLYMARPL